MVRYAIISEISLILIIRLCDVRFTSVHAQINLSNVSIHSTTGDFNAKNLSHVINTDTVNNLVVKTWIDRACMSLFTLEENTSDHLPATRKSTLVFCVDLPHVRDLTNTFREHGIDARYLHGGTKPLERKMLLADFKAGKFPVLINCGTFIPNWDRVAWNWTAILFYFRNLDRRRRRTEHRLRSRGAPYKE